MGVPLSSELDTSPAGARASEMRAGTLAVLRRRKWIFLLALLLVPLAAVLASLRQDALYEARAEVLLSRQNLAASLTGTQDPNLFLGVEGADRVALTQADLARTTAVLRRVLSAAGLSDRTPQDLLAESSVRVKENRDLLQFTVRDRDPDLAKRLADSYAAEFTTYRSELDTAAIRRARSAVEERIAELRDTGDIKSPLYASLVNKAEQLSTLEALQTSNAFVVGSADSAQQVQPRPLRNGVIGLGLGLFLGLLLAFLWEALDTRIRTVDEIGDRLGIPLLGRLPAPPRHLRSNNRLVMAAAPNGPQAEAFRLVRTNLGFVNLDTGAKTIMFTSAVASEGKSTTAANLAIALAREGRDVVLVDLDVRRPFLDKFFELGGRPGLTDVVIGAVPLERAIGRIAISRAQGKLGDGNVHPHILSVLPLGTVPPNPGEFVASGALAELLEKLAQKKEFVLVDAPPLLQVGDAMTLSARVDGMIVVTRLNMLRRATLRELKRALDMSPARKLGFVVTGKHADTGYGYGYQYGPREPGSLGNRVRRSLELGRGRKPQVPQR